jgi:protein involved in polysaccharide export with SLBB domain
MQSNTLDRGRLAPAVRVMALVAVMLAGAVGVCAAQEGVAMEGSSQGESAVSSTYELSPYDVIDVSVYNEEDLHTRTRLGSDGTVLLPLIGTIDLGGKTVVQANEAIQNAYSKGFVKDPHVLLTVLEYRKSTFSILGQVAKPGIYEIPEGSHMSIVDAILLAGGFTRLASQNSVKVKRMVKGKAVVFKERAGAMADSSDVAPFEIRAGDVIKVNESWW